MKKYKFIAFLDDDYMTNRFHEIILDEADICEKSRFFTTPEEALNYFREEPKKENPEIPEVMFLDINMPKMNGWEFLDEYITMKIKQSPVVIMLTTSISSKDKRKARAYEIVKDYMNKPITKDYLTELIKNL